MEERLQEILQIALDYDVSDIHFTVLNECLEKIAIDMRVQGKMCRLKPKKDDLKLFHYLMYRANLDITSIFDPQTGSFEEEVDGMKLSLRFAVVTSYHRTSGVLRILNNHRQLGIDDLTYDRDVLTWLAGITEHRDGLFVFSGPTGSGKTTSLYTILNACHDKTIFTLEDPIEVVNEGYIQLQVNEKQHLSYADGIKQLMRHDPDIVMIGEIRDDEAAQMAVRCALTGHLVVTSIHASGCVSAIHRLLDLGVPEYQLEDVLHGISSQRLYPCPSGMTGIYEFMNREEVAYWFAEKKTSPSFIPLRERIISAVRQGTVRAEDVKEDLAL